ncbi:MAG: hypothetical protein PHS99_04600 [Candidatus Marinimicrobia bacterium]|nr:hypothetical protein [Candidatus Neomarinimicrobiota bacterium]
MDKNEPDSFFVIFMGMFVLGDFGNRLKGVLTENPTLFSSSFRRELFNVCVGIVWQLNLAACSIYFVMKYWKSIALWLGVAVITTGILKFTWYDY